MQVAGQKKYGDDFYVYPAFLGDFTPGFSASVNVIIQQDAAFEWIETTCSGFLDGVTAPAQNNAVLPITIQVTDSGSGRSLFFSPVPINTIAGTGAQPFLLPVTKVFVPLSTITIAATSTDAADTYDDIWFIMIGRRVFEYGSSGR